MWLAGKKQAVADDIAYMNKKTAIMCALELFVMIDEQDQRRLLRLLSVKFNDRG